MDYHKLKVRETADMVNISSGSVSMGMKKIVSKWVPHLLTMEQKQHRIDNSESCLALFTHNKQDFLCRFVIMAEDSGVESTVSWMACIQWKPSEMSENMAVSRQSHGVRFFGMRAV